VDTGNSPVTSVVVARFKAIDLLRVAKIWLPGAQDNSHFVGVV
jgi:hypothetical protein